MSLCFYVASKVKHAGVWRALRDNAGCRIVSTWIDEAGEGQTSDYSELSDRCLSEINKSDVLLLYCEAGEILKGASIEAGAALALGKEVRCVGEASNLSRVFIKHRNWRSFSDLPSVISTLKEDA